jgi:hypothetical protein
MTIVNYNRSNALIYELILFVSRFRPSIKNNSWIKKILENCRNDWVEFRTQIVMADLDKQVKDIHEAWLEDAYYKYLDSFYTEEKPDGSEAQELLGGAMRRTSWWHGKHEPFDPPS